MNNENISAAKRRAKRRTSAGKIISAFEFDFQVTDEDPSQGSVEDYYNIALSEDQIAQLKEAYVALNHSFYQEFLKVSQLHHKDLVLLLLAVALQCVRQYLLTDFKDRDAHTATKAADDKRTAKLYDNIGDHGNNTNTQGGYYYNKLESILLDGVPYDQIFGSKKFDLGLSGQNHRYKTLGHDPVLGWIVGPMNIMTKTMTDYSFRSFHIRKQAKANGQMANSVYSKASNEKIIEACKKRYETEPIAYAAAIAKQAIHFNSDVNTAKSLPIPVIQMISPEWAESLAKYGVDMANVGVVAKQASFSVLINTTIAILHKLLYHPNTDGYEKLYEVRTRKILMYSNAIATTSNTLYVAFTNDLRKLDIGGTLVTVYRIISDEAFIRRVMQEFIDSKVSQQIDDELIRVRADFERLKP